MELQTVGIDLGKTSARVEVLIKFANIKILDLSDLIRDRELKLMCPVNRLVHVDALVLSHHALDLRSSPALVDPPQARLAIMDNSAVKGDAPEVRRHASSCFAICCSSALSASIRVSNSSHSCFSSRAQQTQPG